MKKILLSIIAFLLLGVPAHAGLGQDLSGKILLQVQEHGEAWYIYPESHKRYYLKDGEEAYTIMRFLSLGITDSDLALIPEAADTSEMKQSSSACASHSLANQLKGKILLQVQQNGEAWYVDTEKCRRIYLRDGQAAYDVMRFLGLGITNSDLNKITIAQDSALPDGVEPPPPAAGAYEKKTVITPSGSFEVDIVTIDLNTPGLEIITDALADQDCDTNCPVQPLDSYVSDNGGFAGIHGSYFCPSTYSGCVGQTNYFFYPVFDSDSGNFINEDQLAYPTTGPLWVFDEGNNVHILESTQDFVSVADFEARQGVKIQAAIGNLPLLIRNGQNIVGQAQLDDKQRSTKSSRGGMALKGNTLYLIIAHNSTVIDSASIMEELGVDQGMNLDGGGSSALFYEGEYKVGPGREIPNAIVLRQAS